jgi:hypothetical protein
MDVYVDMTLYIVVPLYLVALLNIDLYLVMTQEGWVMGSPYQRVRFAPYQSSRLTPYQRYRLYQSSRLTPYRRVRLIGGMRLATYQVIKIIQSHIIRLTGSVWCVINIEYDSVLTDTLTNN